MPVINTAIQCDGQTIVQGTNWPVVCFPTACELIIIFTFIYIMFLFLLFFNVFATCIPVINTVVPCYEQTIVQGTNLAYGLFFFTACELRMVLTFIYIYIKYIYSVFILLLFFAPLHIFNHCIHTHT